jgi:hypothetical protein
MALPEVTKVSSEMITDRAFPGAIILLPVNASIWNIITQQGAHFIQ